MGEYEERYPEAYGRGDEPAEPHGPKTGNAGEMPDRFALRRRFGLAASGESAPGWRHSQGASPGIIEPTASPAGTANPADLFSYRGIGPRGYVRSAERIYEDICDRLTENPFIDASDITVSVAGSEATLAGSVDSSLVARQAEAIARQVIGVSWVNNTLLVRPAGDASPAQPADRSADYSAAGR